MNNEDLDEIMKTYTSEEAIHSAKQEKEMNEEKIQPIGRATKNFPQPQRELDLHGHTVPEALREMEYFILKAIEHKVRTVRVITGRGVHSKNLKGVLLGEIEKKLAELKREQKVFAFKKEKTGGSFVVYLIS